MAVCEELGLDDDQCPFEAPSVVLGEIATKHDVAARFDEDLNAVERCFEIREAFPRNGDGFSVHASNVSHGYDANPGGKATNPILSKPARYAVFVRGTSTEATRRWPFAWVPALTPAVYAPLGGHRRHGLEMVRLRAGFFECSTLEVMERERLGLGDRRDS